MNIKRNMSRLDQVLRLGVSLLLVYVGFVDTSLINDTVIGMLVGLLGLVNLFAALTGHCPVYKLAGINTCQSQEL